jgi:hypothetical protein
MVCGRAAESLKRSGQALASIVEVVSSGRIGVSGSDTSWQEPSGVKMDSGLHTSSEKLGRLILSPPDDANGPHQDCTPTNQT